MSYVENLVEGARLTAPRGRVSNLVFFQVRGVCLAPRVRDGDLLLATWRAPDRGAARLAEGELAVFLVERSHAGQPVAMLKRWHGSQAGSGGGAVALGTSSDSRFFLAGQVHLLANHVRPMPRGWRCSNDLLAGTVYAGLDVWFADDVTRILASAHETLTASLRGAPPLDVEMAEVYQQGFVDALRAVAIAFGVAVPKRKSPTIRNVTQVETRYSRLGHLETGEWR